MKTKRVKIHYGWGTGGVSVGVGVCVGVCVACIKHLSTAL